MDVLIKEMQPSLPSLTLLLLSSLVHLLLQSQVTRSQFLPPFVIQVNTAFGDQAMTGIRDATDGARKIIEMVPRWEVSFERDDGSRSGSSDDDQPTEQSMDPDSLMARMRDLEPQDQNQQPFVPARSPMFRMPFRFPSLFPRFSNLFGGRQQQSQHASFPQRVMPDSDSQEVEGKDGKKEEEKADEKDQTTTPEAKID